MSEKPVTKPTSGRVRLCRRRVGQADVGMGGAGVVRDAVDKVRPHDTFDHVTGLAQQSVPSRFKADLFVATERGTQFARPDEERIPRDRTSGFGDGFVMLGERVDRSHRVGATPLVEFDTTNKRSAWPSSRAAATRPMRDAARNGASTAALGPHVAISVLSLCHAGCG